MRVCFAVLLLAIASNTAVGQMRSGSEVKNPDLARTYATELPGGGYVYTGETGRAAIALGVTGFAAYKTVHNYLCTLSYPRTESCGSWAGPWLVVAFIPYIYGIIDAPASANRANERLRSAASHALLERDDRGRTRVGLTITVH